ncbi:MULTISPECIES: hypothetical protein [unclassified Undibacterium]|uniref:hypothetical protein n=1 Tax=unclassified Undibacterium TaxID=2630295 RepID=UPI002AC99396|nr:MULTISPECIES: hypothetical protein [unclassified Undibacterium]MEB0138217.1 hypothetical protein [Undibacterium sp. CCC2.1]MEB0171622.1 hypothetical protein [Undibacterium sp. CCC1.1]MEB0175458.1 hypothetical protein [Undibacterium sp. CCC3.4]MEB0214822.1 hypothetical protein [Undibacterium sp. 5I2]WPX45309.1 hypothetical protein RHM61_08875 [Undibacterium sp. CCC3.4]
MSQFDQLLSSTQVFADPHLNTRFYTAIELLAQIMLVMPRATTVDSLAQACERTPRLIRSILSTLSKDGLVGRDAKEKDAWHCRDCNGIITLADVYRCFADAEERAIAKSATRAAVLPLSEEVAGAETPSRSSSQQSVDLLMMQIKMTVNRAVLQQLEHFDLNRLRGLATTAAFRSQYARPRGYIPEPY